MVKFSLALLLGLVLAINAAEPINEHIVFKKFERKIDLTTQLAKCTNKVIIENTGAKSVKSFLFTLSESEHETLSDISAKAGSRQLKVTETAVSDRPASKVYRVTLHDAIAAGQTGSVVTVEVVLAGAVKPFPVSISQGEKQLVVFEGSHLVPAVYQVTTQTTTLLLPSPNIESYTRLKPSNHHDSSVSYGPYGPTPAFSVDPMKLHYENNGGFMSIKNLCRTLEISHWGNIAVEETFDIVHTGAKLNGAFSRYDYQRDHAGHAVVRSLHTVLPASARDVYYRDEIGNISTSNLRVRDDSVEIDLRPRFPLFGSWKTHYKLGYNVPSYEYLHQSGDQFALQMRILDHVFDNMIVEDLVVKIILPEGVSEIELDTAYPMTRRPDTLHATYLDTTGRLVVTLHAKQLTPTHIRNFLLAYKFSMLYMLREPCLVAAAFFALFVTVMVCVRVDLTLCADAAVEAQKTVAALCAGVATHHHTRTGLYRAVAGEISKLCGGGSNPKAVSAFTAATTKLMASVKEETVSVAALATKIRGYGGGPACERVTELVRADKEVQEALTAQVANMTRLLKATMTKQAYVEAETGLARTSSEAMQRCKAAVAFM